MTIRAAAADRRLPLLRDLLLAQRRIHRLEARIRELRGDDMVGLDVADWPTSILSWMLDANEEGAREESIGLPAATPRELDVVFRTVHQVLARMHPHAGLWLHQIVGGALSEQFGCWKSAPLRVSYYDALCLLRELGALSGAEREARALRSLRLRILHGRYNSLLPWMDFEALARPGADTLMLLCTGVERFLLWFAECGDPEHAGPWNVLRFAAHARLLRDGIQDGMPAMTFP